MKPLLAKFIVAAASPEAFPVEGPPEFAFLGRSNTGKSSLINSMLRQRLAHVSSTPGRTRTINFIGVYARPGHIHPELILVDLPGYGYAKVSREISAGWPKFIDPYLRSRKTLKLVVVLIDANVPPQENDRQLLDFLRSIGRDVVVVATKTDKLSGNRQSASLTALARDHGIEHILPYSATTGLGREQLWREIRARVQHH